MGGDHGVGSAPWKTVNASAVDSAIGLRGRMARNLGSMRLSVSGVRHRDRRSEDVTNAIGLAADSSERAREAPGFQVFSDLRENHQIRGAVPVFPKRVAVEPEGVRRTAAVADMVPSAPAAVLRKQHLAAKHRTSHRTLEQRGEFCFQEVSIEVLA
jgi:hypothetical protein